MGWQNIPPFSIDEAQQRGVDVYELLYSDWGMDVENDQWPEINTSPIPISLAGVAIGPRSTVDRAWLTYNLQKTFTEDANAVPYDLTGRIRQVSVDAPLLFSQAASGQGTPPISTHFSFEELRHMNTYGSLYVFPQSLWPVQGPNPPIDGGTQYEFYDSQLACTGIPGNTYVDVNGVVRFLGATGTTRDYPLGGWVGPMLHLYMYLKAPVMVPTKRAPLKCAMKVDTASAARIPTPAGERLVAQIATFGRSTVHVMMKADRSCKFRVGAIRVFGNASGALNNGQQVPSAALEEPVDVTTVSIAPNTPAVMNECAAANLYADFLNLYATADDASSPIVWFNVSGYD